MNDEFYMRRCFQLALNGLGYAAPNPMVGAVIVHNDRIIGEGYHRKCGGPHAEVNAVNSVSAEDEHLLTESTIYVSLEPCAHYGKTPPCAKLLIDKKIPHVVVSCDDPFPKVSGRGFSMLREAGAVVETGVLQKEGWELNRRFFTFQIKKRPYVILKWAQSADHFMAADGGKPVKISTDNTLPLVHKLRADESAIMVGTNTAVNDNPSLTIRYAAGQNPLRILIDRNLRVPFTANIYNKDADTLVFTQKTPYVLLPNVTFVDAPFDANGVNLDYVMESLYQRQVQSLIVEGGSALLNSFLNAGLVDECRVETAESLNIGGGVVAPQPVGTLVGTEVYGSNVITHYRVF